jgi:autotransporter-associated beta strand protein
MPLLMWKTSPGSNDYNNASNWSTGLAPNYFDAASFGNSTTTSISLSGLASSALVGEWIFKPGAPAYSFTVSGNLYGLLFAGGGIFANGDSVHIEIGFESNGEFVNYSSAGTASITVDPGGELFMIDFTSCGSATIENNGDISLEDASSAGSATIHTLNLRAVDFMGFSTGGNAQFNTDAGGTVDFSQSTGPANNHQLSVGLIEGGGTYLLGADQVTVGGKKFSMVVSGPVDDGGLGGGIGGSLLKVGKGTLTLTNADNTYSGGTLLQAGTLDLRAVEAAGTGDIAFGGKAGLKIENTALSSHHFGNPIDFFGTFSKADILDLTGLKFRSGAAATYHKTTHHLSVHSGKVTDTLTLFDLSRTDFIVSNDGHGGTKVTLAPPLAASSTASLTTHAVVGQDWIAETAGGAHHSGDFLFLP